MKINIENFTVRGVIQKSSCKISCEGKLVTIGIVNKTNSKETNLTASVPFKYLGYTPILIGQEIELRPFNYKYNNLLSQLKRQGVLTNEMFVAPQTIPSNDPIKRFNEKYPTLSLKIKKGFFHLHTPNFTFKTSITSILLERLISRVEEEIQQNIIQLI